MANIEISVQELFPEIRKFLVEKLGGSPDEYSYSCKYVDTSYYIAFSKKILNPDPYYYKDPATAKEVVHQFNFGGFRHCCGLVISSNAGTSSKFQHKGVGTFMNEMRVRLANQSGYGSIIGSVVDGTYSDKIMIKNKWNKLYSFKNPRTRNLVNVYMRTI